MKKTKKYKVELGKLKQGVNADDFKQYLLKDLGYLVLLVLEEESKSWCFIGFITPEDLKKRISLRLWSKICSGKKEYINFET